MPTHARDRLLDTAERLFYADGIRAVGIERILAESGVGRASLYRHFPGKDDLVVAVLERRDRHWRAWMSETVDRIAAPGTPGRPLAVFDALAERFTLDDFRGCAFINTIVETADPTSPAHVVAAEHKDAVNAYVESLLVEAGYDQHAVLAGQFALLMDGAIVASLRERTTACAYLARATAEAVLTAASRTAVTAPAAR